MNKAGFLKSLSYTAYEDDPALDPQPGAEPTPKVEPNNDDKFFTQDQVDQIIKDRLARADKKAQEAANVQAAELERLRETATLSDDERSKLNDRIEQLKAEGQSAEERKKKEVGDLKKTLEEKTKDFNDTITKVTSEFNSYRMDHELREAALAHDALTPTQLVGLLLRDTEVKEVLNDDGSATGRTAVFTTITEKAEDGTDIQVSLSPMEAVARLKSMPEIWGNQFRSNQAGGIEAQMGIGNPKPATTDLVTDKGYDAYIKSVEANPDKLYGNNGATRARRQAGT